jgi:DNA sulfur modification protein DndC
LKRDLKEAVEKGDVAKVKQLTLADFTAPNTEAIAPNTQTDTTKPETKAKAWANKKFKNKTKN